MGEAFEVRHPPRLVPPPRPVARNETRPGGFPWTVVGILLMALSLCRFAWLWVIDGQAVGAALVLIPILVLLTVPLMVRASRSERTFDLAGLLLVGLAMRFTFAHYRMTHAFDAVVYHQWGVRLAGAYRALDFGADPGQQVPGTGGLRIISGIVHVLVNDDYFAAFLVMAWLGFWGCWFLYRAAIIAVPDLKRYRFALFMFCWPSLAFWPSSLGKDAWMLFTVGLASLGAAKVFRRITGGYTLLFGGLFLGSFVRPHLMLVALFAFVVALVVGRRENLTSRLTPASLAKIAALLLAVAFATVLLSRTRDLVGNEDFSVSSVQSSLSEVGGRTVEGNSRFDAPNPLRPTGYPIALVTVLFRPVPFEARGLEQLVAAAEGAFLIVLSIASYKGLLSVLRRLRTQPYVTYSALFVLLWAAVFGIISNFGILARQRSQMLPFYFLLLSLPALAARLPQRERTSTARP
jgi:hypothetical protein